MVGIGTRVARLDYHGVLLAHSIPTYSRIRPGFFEDARVRPSRFVEIHLLQWNHPRPARSLHPQRDDRLRRRDKERQRAAIGAGSEKSPPTAGNRWSALRRSSKEVASAGSCPSAGRANRCVEIRSTSGQVGRHCHRRLNLGRHSRRGRHFAPTRARVAALADYNVFFPYEELDQIAQQNSPRHSTAPRVLSPIKRKAA